MLKAEKNLKEKDFTLSDDKLYCEKYREWVDEGEPCKHKSDYCAFRKQCLIFLKEKLKSL